MALDPQGMSMRDKLRRRGTQMAKGKSDPPIVPMKPGNAGGGKGWRPLPRLQHWASTAPRGGPSMSTRASLTGRWEWQDAVVGSRMR